MLSLSWRQWVRGKVIMEPRQPACRFLPTGQVSFSRQFEAENPLQEEPESIGLCFDHRPKACWSSKSARAQDQSISLNFAKRIIEKYGLRMNRIGKGAAAGVLPNQAQRCVVLQPHIEFLDRKTRPVFRGTSIQVDDADAAAIVFAERAL